MKCFLIRDLLPLYIEGGCLPETTDFVEEHLQSCEECREMFELMNDPIDVKDFLDPRVNQAPEQSSEVMQKYYGKLIAKGAGMFIMIYIIIVMTALLF
jgi:predicted anti-sigma-YlaC factor YlaD